METIMYYTGSWGFEIKEVLVVRRSDKSVWLMHGNRERRESDTYYFDTWELAKQSIIDRETRDVFYAEQNLSNAKNDLERAISITKK